MKMRTVNFYMVIVIYVMVTVLPLSVMGEGDTGTVLENIEKKLLTVSDDHERSELLFEKVKLLMEQPQETAMVEEMTNNLLEAIDLAPYEEEYSKLLFIMYYRYWKYPAENISDEDKKDLRGKVMEQLKSYNLNKNFDYLAGPYEVKEFINKLNDQGIHIVKDEQAVREKDEVTIYSAEYGWFELEESTNYFELYIADINNDGEFEYILIESDELTDSLTISSVYTWDGNEYKNIFFTIKEHMWNFIEQEIKGYYGLEKYPGMKGLEVIISKEDGDIYFTQVLQPFWADREQIGYRESWFTFLWKDNELQSTKIEIK